MPVNLFELENRVKDKISMAELLEYFAPFLLGGQRSDCTFKLIPRGNVMCDFT